MYATSLKSEVETFLEKVFSLENRFRNLSRYMALPQEVINRQKYLRDSAIEILKGNYDYLTPEAKQFLNALVWGLPLPQSRFDSGLGLFWFIPVLIGAALGVGGIWGIAKIRETDTQSKALDLAEQGINVAEVYGPEKPVESDLFSKVFGISGASVLLLVGGILSLPWLIKKLRKK